MLFQHLLGRALGEATGVHPRRASRFEVESPIAVMDVHSTPDAPRGVSRPGPEPAGHAPTAERILPPTERLIVERHRETRVEPVFAAPQTRTAVPEAPAAVSSATINSEPFENVPIHRPTPEAPVRKDQTTPLAERMVIRSEQKETRVEHHSIETRLERLRQEVQREQVTVIEKAAAISAAPPEVPSTPAPIPPVAPPERFLLAPATQPARPVAAELRPMAPAATTPDPAPEVHITIGRLEIRTSSPASNQSRSVARDSRPSLSDYLRKREGA